MGKHKDKKNTFTKALKEHADKIKIKTGPDDEEVTLKDIVESSIDGITATTIDGMVPVSVTEASENAINDLPYMAISTHYSEAVFSMYESSIKSVERKQTLLIPLTLDAADTLSDSERLMSVLGDLKKNTDILLVMDKLPKKVLKAAKEWANDDSSTKAFVVRIPNLVMFLETISKTKVSNALLFDVILVFSNAKEKSLRKAKKNSPAHLDAFADALIENVINISKNFGVSSLHVPLWDEFYTSPYKAAQIWADKLSTAEKLSILKKLMFSTPDARYLIAFNQELARIINADEGNGMRVI